jgi:serine/threonine protein kinase
MHASVDGDDGFLRRARGGPSLMARANPPSIPPLASGKILGDKFEILAVLGEGGAGTVYDALRLPEQERIALKVLHSHLLGDRQIRGRFEREARILRRLHGPHVCPVLEFGELPDPRREGQELLYMALPKIDGPALDTVLHREGPLPLDRAIDVILQVLDALKMAHAQGIIHRDLKPANVLLRGGTHVVVVDFGLAKIVAGEAGTTVLTAQNMVCGTPEYMAPEQARGDEIDARCDVYAAGVILYELLTGAVPFTGVTPLNVLTEHLTSTPEPPRVRAPARGISKALEAVVLHAMAKSPGERYPSAAAFAAAILHARAEGDDVVSVRPVLFGADPSAGERADAETEAETDPHGPTLPAAIPSVRPAPRETSGAPPAVRTAPPPPVPRPTTHPPREGLSARGWALIWIVTALLSISLGVWLSLAWSR